MNVDMCECVPLSGPWRNADCTGAQRRGSRDVAWDVPARPRRLYQAGRSLDHAEERKTMHNEVKDNTSSSSHQLKTMWSQGGSTGLVKQSPPHL